MKNAIGCTGIGLHTGTKVSMMIRPAAPDSGIRFKRTDISGGQAVITGDWRNVVESKLCSTIANADGIEVKTIEHLMAALAGLEIDNALIEVNGPEIPIMDGSAAPFVFLIECAGIEEQDAKRHAVKVLKPVTVTDESSEAALLPSDSFSVTFSIEFESPLIACQDHFVEFVNGTFKREIANARTFGLEHEVAALRAGGLLLGGSLDNAVVVSGDRVLNDSGLRYGDEFVRHKILDSVGDLYLAGAPILGHFKGSRSGHAMNHRLLATLFADPKAWAMVPMRREPAGDFDLDAPIVEPTARVSAGAIRR
ncbi:MAG: UDP-3-O-acyl-N-acetylglucosamine deacetylase [Alphaproteobacteria bacterium]|nr:UDP-3-O-acyl-N-acetylglucosamine deacetylase [Alphaproteobacteria bacterium]